jgi:large subunit ribosomal protein L29
MKYSEIKGMTKEQLEKKVQEVKSELIKLNGQVATGSAPKEAGKIKELKKTLARIYTFETTKMEEGKKDAGN